MAGLSDGNAVGSPRCRCSYCFMGVALVALPDDVGTSPNLVKKISCLGVILTCIFFLYGIDAFGFFN